MMKFPNLLLNVMVLFFLWHLLLAEADLRVGFYNQTCPNAESIIASVVKEATATNIRIPAILLRLHFHDCFVEGCDGSILIDNTERPEKNALGHLGVQGFVEVEKAKAKLEAECPGVVSCADIVALSARDSVVLSGGTSYAVETGRRDGRVSDHKLAADMPEVDEPIDALKAKFINKGLSPIELVLLSGAHTIGTTACFFMPKRLYNFSGKQDSDPSINSIFLPELQNTCPKNGNVNKRLSLDHGSDTKFDNKILQNIKEGFAILSSDARLYDDNEMKKMVDFYSEDSSSAHPGMGPPFLRDFGIAMVKLGRLGVKTGMKGEIRKVCNSFN